MCSLKTESWWDAGTSGRRTVSNALWADYIHRQRGFAYARWASAAPAFLWYWIYRRCASHAGLFGSYLAAWIKLKGVFEPAFPYFIGNAFELLYCKSLNAEVKVIWSITLRTQCPLQSRLRANLTSEQALFTADFMHLSIAKQTRWRFPLQKWTSPPTSFLPFESDLHFCNQPFVNNYSTQ